MALNPAIKRRVRAELFRSAVQGQFLTYTEFYNRIHPGAKMGSFPYQTHFDEIAREERKNRYPDITFLVHGSGNPPQYPKQIEFRPADPRPDTGQLESLRKGTDDLIAMYCPGTRNP